MSLLANLNTADDVQEDADITGGGGFAPWESDVYKLTISMAYLFKAASGAMGLTLFLTNEEGKELRFTTYVTSGDAKGNRTYYEKDGERRNLPGYALFRSLTLMTLNLEPTQVDTEEKVVKLYSPEAKAEVPTTVPVLVDLLGKEIFGGVQQVVEDKNVKDANGNYGPSGETRTINNVDKFFHFPSGLTVAEAKAGNEKGEFIEKWKSNNQGQVIDKSTKGAKAPAGGGAAPAQSGAFGQAAQANTPKPATSLFG